MTAELYWLTLTALMTALFWLPYVLNRIQVRGLMEAMGYETEASAAHAPWADRAMAAHRNAIENLAVFAALVLTANAIGVSSTLTVWAAIIYFFARLAHYLIVIAKISMLRTLAFFIGWLCQMVFALAILGLI